MKENLQLLLVGDDETALELITDLLEPEGFEV
jgi:CheY-like chemotaxis protein